MKLYKIKEIDFKNKQNYKLFYKNGRFYSNLDSSKHLNFINLFKWQILKIKNINFKREKTCLKNVNEKEKLKDSFNKIVWLSHASFYIKLNDFDILIDPVFFDIPGFKRYIDPPYKIEEFEKIDLVLISHSHYDHCDKRSLFKIYEKFNPLFITPKFLNLLPKNAKTADMLWFEVLELNGIKIYFLPAKHWSRRGLFDKNRSLWGSFLIKSEKISIYFAGDSGYDRHFKDIGENFDINIALLPIGAYSPSFIMKPSHLNPKEALKAFEDLNAKIMIPMHYGVYKLSDEPLCEPAEILKKYRKSTIEILNPGEIFVLE